MSYAIIQLEITEPLPPIQTQANETGIALIIRYQDCPIGFVMQALAPNTMLPSETLKTLLIEKIGKKLLQEKIRKELRQNNRDNTVFPSLTVAICTKDRTDNLTRCLDSLFQLKQPDNLSFEILVVDNAPSNEDTKNLVESWQNLGKQKIRYVREPKTGLDFARNLAMREATGEILAYIDDDVILDRQWLAGLMAAYQENPDAACFTGMVLPYELETEAQILFELRGGFVRGFEKIRYGQVLPGNFYYPCNSGIFGAGCNMSFRREVLLKLGGFDEALDTGKPLPGGGDLDIFYRVVRTGYPLVYEPQYLVYHQHRRELDKLRYQYWTWGLSVMAFVVKSYQYDPSQRGKLQRLVVSWFKDHLRLLAKSVLGRYFLPANMIWAEVWGSVVGLFGEYSRSCKRVEQISKQVEVNYESVENYTP